MRGTVSKLIHRKVMEELNQKGLKGKAKVVVFTRGCRETKKRYESLNNPGLPKVVLMKKQHVGEPIDKFKSRRKACNVRRREREKLWKMS